MIKPASLRAAIAAAVPGLEANPDKLPEDKGEKIVLYCRSDRMSRIAAETMINLGYTNIWNLEDGMVAWEQTGREIEK